MTNCHEIAKGRMKTNGHLTVMCRVLQAQTATVLPRIRLLVPCWVSQLPAAQPLSTSTWARCAPQLADPLVWINPTISVFRAVRHMYAWEGACASERSAGAVRGTSTPSSTAFNNIYLGKVQAAGLLCDCAAAELLVHACACSVHSRSTTCRC